MTLAKALKEKNKLKNEISLLQKKLNEYNAVLKGNKRPFNAEELNQSIIDKVNGLIELKTMITKANQPVQNKIYKLAELRGLISFYKKLPAKDGKVVHDYKSETYDYEAFYNESDLEKKINAIENEVDILQDELEAFNHTTTL